MTDQEINEAVARKLGWQETSYMQGFHELPFPMADSQTVK